MCCIDCTTIRYIDKLPVKLLVPVNVAKPCENCTTIVSWVVHKVADSIECKYNIAVCTTISIWMVVNVVVLVPLKISTLLYSAQIAPPGPFSAELLMKLQFPWKVSTAVCFM